MKVKESEIALLDREYIVGNWGYQSLYKPINVVEAEGSYFFDDMGNKYLDFSSQLISCNLGHKHKDMVESIQRQAEKITYFSPAFATEPKAKLAKMIGEVTPKNLKKVFFSTSGTEANEAAIKTIKLKGGFKIISRYRSYHGSTYGSITLSGDPRRLPAEPGVPGIIHAPDAYCYRCPFGKEYPDCGIMCAEYIEEMIEMEGEDRVGGVVVEPIPGSNGILVPPDEYLPRLREICTETNTLLVSDEVMTGFGRTGAWFGVDLWGVEPDLITMGKGITASYIPLGATVMKKEVAEFFEENYFAHGHTYTGHALACAAGVTALEVYKRDKLIEKAKKVGETLGRRLRELGEDHVSVGDIRGKGLFWGMELVRNRKTKERFSTRADKLKMAPTMLDRVRKEAMDKALYVMGMINTLMIAPPLTVREEEIDEGISVLDAALKISDRETVS